MGHRALSCRRGAGGEGVPGWASWGRQPKERGALVDAEGRECAVVATRAAGVAQVLWVGA
jgi:hypothetical protein